MRVLTLYASAHGSTAEVAHFIADAWQKRSIDTTVAAVGSIQSLAGYGAYALGSAIHHGLWLPEMATFVRRSGRALADKPVYLWLTCLRAIESDGFAYVTNNYLPNLLSRAVSFRRIGIFAGKVDVAALNPEEAWTLTFRYDGSKGLPALSGDHRDWKLIRAWAEQVAADLEATA